MWFILGLAIGVIAGYCVASIMWISGESSDAEDRFWREVDKEDEQHNGQDE